MSPDTSTAALAEIQDIAHRCYQERTERAFVHWALKCLLADLDPSEEDLIAHTALDGSGDLGIDGYWLDDTNNRVYLLQAKYQQRARRTDAVALRGAIESLAAEEYVRRHGNLALREAYPDIIDRLIDEEYPVFGVLASRGSPAPAATAYASAQGSTQWLFDLAGATRRKELQLQVFDIEGLISLRQTLLAPTTTPVVTLHVPQTVSGPCLHFVSGECRTIQSTVAAKDIVEAYATHRSGIFRDNPRGPQGSNKVNKDIESTIKDDILKRSFHLLNNGLTVVCDSVEYDESQRALTITDFQIVNGCQTVFTLHSFRHCVTDEVFVGLRIIEGHNWAPMIAKSTNSQTAVRPEQLASLGPEHDRIFQDFDQLDPPWSYEKQQGSRRFLTAGQRQIHRARYDTRIVTVREVGQFGAAFMGYPILAKYDLKVLFERAESTGQRLYAALFGPDSRAEQLLLPVLVGRRVHQNVRDRVQALRQEQQQQQAQSPEVQPFSEVDWLSYARMHLPGLMGEVLRAQSPSDVTPERLMTLAASRRLRGTMDDWFPATFERARLAVKFYVEVEKAAGRLVNLREFFRSAQIYARMEEQATTG